MSEKDSQLLWQDIVRLTNESDNECIRSLRVALLMWLRAPADPPLRQLRHFSHSAGALLPKRKIEFPIAKSRQYVFCFAADTPSSIRPLLPVLDEADRRGKLAGIVTPHMLPGISRFAGRIPIVTMEVLSSQLSAAEKIEIATGTLRTYKEISRMLNRYDERYASRFSSNIGTALEMIATSLQMAKAFRSLFDRWQPACVVSVGDFWPFSYQFIYQASSLEIPSVLVQHGVCDFFWFPFVADLYCLWGEADLEEMKRYGAPPEKLTAVGLPSMDEVFRRGESVQDEPVRNGRQPVLLVLSNTHGSAFEPAVFDDYLRFLAEAVKSTPSVTWKVKLHPAEDDSFYRKMGSFVFDRLVFHPKGTPLADAVSDADVVTTIYSTAGLEAMIMNRPLIIAPLSARVRELAPWPASGGGVYVSSAAELRTHFSKLISSHVYKFEQMTRQRDFLASRFANHGSAANRIVDLLEQSQGPLLPTSPAPSARIDLRAPASCL